MDQRRVKVGVVGCGNISPAYFKNMPNFGILDVAACADMLPERAQGRSTEFNIPRACSVEELLADPEIEIVVNLTIPKAHHEVALAALKAGKCVYSEKPLALTREQGQELLRHGQGPGRAAGRRARYLPRRRPPDLPQAHRRRLDRHARRRHRLHDLPRPRELAPRPGVLLPGRRRPHVRHGPLLPHRPGQPAGPRGRASPARRASPSPSAPSPASPSTARWSRSRCPPTSPACSTSPTALSPPSSPALTSGAPTCRGSRSTAPRARSACPTPTASGARS